MASSRPLNRAVRLVALARLPSNGGVRRPRPTSITRIRLVLATHAITAIFDRRLNRWHTIVLAALVFLPRFGTAADVARAETDADFAARIVILANSTDPDSLRIAQHYAGARAVPMPNIVALPMPAHETITWPEFVTQVWEPLLAQLVRERWIDAIAMDLRDSVGRRKYAVNHHRIAALVVCRGVPLKIAHDPALYAEVLPYTTRNEFRTNAGAVDAELSLLAAPNYPINAFVPNPLFQNVRPTAFERDQVVEVSRLDGPSVGDALALVDHALVAERTGLLGRAYVDLSDRDAVGNGWLEATAAQLEALKLDLTVDRDPALIPLGARFDAPVLYFGWYAHDIGGAFLLPEFRFPPGAIALHIHSYSAATLRSATSGWTGPLVARGVTATVGNVNEPYLDWTHRPNLLLRSLARGARLVDAAYYALQSLSWQDVLIGDPMYRPFAVSLEEQWANLDRLPPRLAAYAVLRRSHLMESTGHPADALQVLRDSQRKHPSLAIGFALAEKLRLQNDATGAAAALGFVANLKTIEPDEWGLAREAARLLVAIGRPSPAIDLWRALLAEKTMPRELRDTWLGEAARAAEAAGDTAQAELWRSEHLVERRD